MYRTAEPHQPWGQITVFVHIPAWAGGSTRGVVYPCRQQRAFSSSVFYVLGAAPQGPSQPAAHRRMLGYLEHYTLLNNRHRSKRHGDTQILPGH